MKLSGIEVPNYDPKPYLHKHKYKVSEGLEGVDLVRKNFCVSLDSWLIPELEKEAKDRGVPISRVVRDAILERYESK